MDAPQAQVTVARTLERDIGIREVQVWLDEELIANLKHHQSVTRVAVPGHHTVRAHNTLVGKRIEFELAEGEHARFTTANRSGCATSLIFILGAGPIYLSLERDETMDEA
jgi:ribosomal protein L3